MEQKFKKGDVVWFKHWTGRAKSGRILRYWKGIKSYELAIDTHTFNELELFTSEKEALEAK